MSFILAFLDYNSFVVVLFFFAVVVFRCFYSSLSLLCSLLFIQFFVFALFSLGVPPRSNHKVSEILISCSASVPASPHFHLAQIITLLGPEKNPSKWFLFALFVAFNNVLKYLFLIF